MNTQEEWMVQVCLEDETHLLVRVLGLMARRQARVEALSTRVRGDGQRELFCSLRGGHRGTLLGDLVQTPGVGRVWTGRGDGARQVESALVSVGCSEPEGRELLGWIEDSGGALVQGRNGVYDVLLGGTRARVDHLLNQVPPAWIRTCRRAALGGLSEQESYKEKAYGQNLW